VLEVRGRWELKRQLRRLRPRARVGVRDNWLGGSS
jgi:hypothetical protein